MADTQRDGRDGRTNGGSADRPDRAAPLEGADPVPWRVESPAGWRPGATTAACSGHGSGCSCWGCWTTFPSCRRAPVRPVVAGSKHPEVHLRLSENGSVKPSFVMRPLAMVVTSLRPDGWKSLTARHGSRSRQRGGLTSGRSALSSIFDRASTQSDQIELANLWQAAVEGARPCKRPGAGPGLACWLVVEPPAGIEPATPSLPWNHRPTAMPPSVFPGRCGPYVVQLCGQRSSQVSSSITTSC
jgi:hypothetical protein